MFIFQKRKKMMNRKLALVIKRDNLHKVFPINNQPDFDLFGLMERTLCETDTNYLQIIPYITLFNKETKKYFVYTRGGKGNEGRLHGKCSVGLGGHIETTPNYELNENFKEFILEDAYRELEEEVGINEEMIDTYIEYVDVYPNVLLSDANEVDMVHVGIPIIIIMKTEELPQLEEGVITKGNWLTHNEIMKLVDSGEIQLEQWSKMMLRIPVVTDAK